MPTQEPIQAPLPVGSETSTSRACRKRKSLIDPSVEKISQKFHNFVKMVGPWFKSLVEATTRKEDHEDAHEKASEATCAKLKDRKQSLLE